MGSNELRRRTLRTTAVENLEVRMVMSADAFAGLLSAPIVEQSKSLADNTTAEPLNDAVLGQHGALVSEPPSLSHHVGHDADFWLDPTFERDLDQMLGEVEQSLASAHGTTGLTQVRNSYGFIGAGQTVAIIDSGIAYDHFALGGGYGPNYRVVGGWDFTEENDWNFFDEGPLGSHGSHVAGIVGAAAPGLKDTGVAPGVDLVGLRVFNDMGAGYFSWVENALRWVHTNRYAFENPITAVNLSIGTSWNSNTVPLWSTLEDELAQLKADGIFISVSAGNSFASSGNTPGLSYPAASPSVVPVMSVDDNGQLSSFSQRHTRAIAAPGRYIVSTIPDYVGNHNGMTDDFASFSGTSMAAPYIAGASVLVREAMQFVGHANITQDTILDHMLATADSVFDAATGQSYKRLNLARAINALMPADDFGSSVTDAYNLGTLDATGAATTKTAFGGLIGDLKDVDYFRFTAGMAGKVTFTADATHALAPVWRVLGANDWTDGGNGETYSFEVVAGQSYSIGLSSAGGVGYYNLSIDVETDFNCIDLGAVTQIQVNDARSTGPTWFRMQASRTGYLTADALFAAADGNAAISIYDRSRQLLATAAAADGSARIDVLATAGAEFYFRVAGNKSEVDFSLTNLVSLDSTMLQVAGTTADDTFTFETDAVQHTISVNGTTYHFARAAVSAIRFVGDAGQDAITMTGTSKNETATFRPASSTFAGAGFTTTASGVENVTIYGGGGNDLARFYDSAGNDGFVAKQTFSIMTGAGFHNFAAGFATVYAYATAGGVDVAELYDSPGNDHFWGKPSFSLLAGDDFYRFASNFDQVYAYAFAGGADVAELYDSPDNDVLISMSERSQLRSSVSTNHAISFGVVYAYSFLGGVDLAHFHDSPGDDVYIGKPGESVFRGGGSVRVAVDFERVKALSTSGGDDIALLLGSIGNDSLFVHQDQTWLYGERFEVSSHGFRNVRASGEGGDDTSVFDQVGTHDFLYGMGSMAQLRRDGRTVELGDFDRVIARIAVDSDPQVDLLAIDYLFEQSR